MNEREWLEQMRESVLNLAKTSTIQQVLIDKMADKLVELMGEEAFEEWGASIPEEAERVAQAEVERLEAEVKDMRATSEGVQFS